MKIFALLFISSLIASEVNWDPLVLLQNIAEVVNPISN